MWILRRLGIIIIPDWQTPPWWVRIISRYADHTIFGADRPIPIGGAIILDQN